MTSAADLLERLRRRLECYREMARASEEQKDLLTSGNLDGLMSFVERKRALMDEIEALDLGLAPVRERWPEVRGRMAADDVRRVEAVVAETKEALGALVALENEAGAVLRPGGGPGAGPAGGFVHRRRAAGAYGVPEPGFRRFDRKE